MGNETCRNEEKCGFSDIFRSFLLFLQHNSEAYDRGEQEIQAEFHGGTNRRDAAGTDGRRGEGCQGVECQGGGGETAASANSGQRD